MFYFTFHINDFIADTRHLNPLEIGLLLLIMLHYYQTESPIRSDELDKLFRKLCIQEQDRTIAKDLLEEFCVQKDGAYHWDKIEKDLAVYHQNLEYKSIAGKMSGESRRRKKTEAAKDFNSCSTAVHNQKPSITNHESSNIIHESFNNIQQNSQTSDFLNLWNPTLEEINIFLRQANLGDIDEQSYNSNRVKFLTYYNSKVFELNKHQIMGKFVKWIENQKNWSTQGKSKNLDTKYVYDESRLPELLEEGDLL